MGSWTCLIESESALEMRFAGPQGRFRAEVFQGRLTKELYHGLKALGNPRERLHVRADFLVHFGLQEQILRIESQSGRGGRAVLKLVGANARWPRFLVSELREIFQDKVEPGAFEENIRRAGAEAGVKGRGIPKPQPSWTPERRAKQLETLRAKGQKVKADQPKPKRRKKRGRKKKVIRERNVQGHEHLPEAPARGGQGDRPSGGLDSRQVAEDFVITASEPDRPEGEPIDA